jgi:hypothetical protein
MLAVVAAQISREGSRDLAIHRANARIGGVFLPPQRLHAGHVALRSAPVTRPTKNAVADRNQCNRTRLVV